MIRKSIIISPSLSIAHFWINKMDLDLKKLNIVVPGMEWRLYGYRACNVYAYLYGEPFDYPEETKPGFEDFCKHVESMLGVDEHER